MFKPDQQPLINATLARETMITQLAARETLLTAARPQLTLGGYGKAAIDVFGRQIIIDAQLSNPDEFVTMARARVKKSEDEFHNIDVTLGNHSLLAKVYDQDGHTLTDWQTTLSLAILMRCARIRPRSLKSRPQDGILFSR